MNTNHEPEPRYILPHECGYFEIPPEVYRAFLERQQQIKDAIAQGQPTGPVEPRVKSIEVWPSLLVESWGHLKASGPVRLSFLARTLDPSGSGVVSPGALWEAAKELRIPKRTFAAWKSDALHLGIFTQLNGWTLRITSQQKLFKLLNCQTVDKTKVIIPLKSLFSKGWRAVVWAAYLQANHNDRPISQQKLQEITGVSVSAQKNTLHKHYKSKRQYGITSYSADMVGMFNEYTSHGKAFAFRDPKRGNRKVTAINLPSIKQVSNKTARTAHTGRRTAILAYLARFGLGCNHRLLSNSLQPNKIVTRLFYSTTPKQLKQAIRLTQAMSRLPQDPDRIFVKRGKYPAWDVHPLQDVNFFIS